MIFWDVNQLFSKQLKIRVVVFHVQLFVQECVVKMLGVIPHLTQLIEMILVIAVVAIILFMTVPQVSGWIKNNVFNPLTGAGIPLGTEEATLMENAIRCSYARCVYGCGSGTVKSIDIGATKNCNTDYCVPFQQNGKVCGQNAMNHPIPAVLLTSQTLDKSKVKTETNSCMKISDGCYGYTISGATGEKGWIYVQKDATTDKAWEEEKCNTIIPYVYEITGYGRILIDANKYNIWTDDQGGTVVCISS